MTVTAERELRVQLILQTRKLRLGELTPQPASHSYLNTELKLESRPPKPGPASFHMWAQKERGKKGK